MLLILAIVLLVLFFAWRSYATNDSRQEETLVYLNGDDNDPDSDSDMQEQYDYLTNKKKE